MPSVIPDALRRWDDNGNGRITCAEARRHGIAPVPRSHPAYGFMFDRDGDGSGSAPPLLAPLISRRIDLRVSPLHTTS